MAGPPTFLQSLPIETDATDGDIVTFQVKVSVSSSDPTTVSWWRCGEPLRPVPGHREMIEHEDGWHELILSNITQDDEGEYECRAENDRGHNSSFGSLYYYREGCGTISDVTMEGIIAEGDGRQSGLLILIDDGSNTEESLSGHSDRKSMTVSEQMQGIIEDLTQSSQGERTGSLTFEKEDDNQFYSDIEDLCDDDLEANVIQDILGMTSKHQGSEDTLIPEMPSPDLHTDVAISEGASDPYAPAVPMEAHKWKSNPNISKGKRDKGEARETEGEGIWPPEAAIVTFDLPDDTATTSVELPFAKGSTTEDELPKGSWRCADTPFDVADITEEAVDISTSSKDAESLHQSPIDDTTRDFAEADSAVKVVAFEELLPIPTQTTDSRVNSRIEQDTSLTSITEFSGEAILPEGCQQSKMSFTKSSFKSSSYQYSGDGVMDTATSVRTSSVTSRMSFDEESISVSKSSRMTRRVGELEDDSLSVSMTTKKTKLSSAYEADESSLSASTTVNRSLLADRFMTEALGDSKLDKKLQEDNKCNEVLKKVEEVSGIERRKLVLGACFALGLMVVIGYGAQLICNGVGFAYPAYTSILAIESRNKDDDTLWLTYWVVFAGLSLIEFFSDFILALIPFYWLLKCIFLIWCFVPSSMNGSKFIYYRFIRPVFLSHLGQAETEENTPGEEHEKSS